MTQVVFNHVGGKPPFFDGVSSFDHWKRKMKQYLGSINEKVWEVTHHDYAIIDPDASTTNATLWLSTLSTIGLIQRSLSKSRILRWQVKCGQD
jgi:hypothetical protein